MTVSRYGIPYQGSKGNSAARIYRAIAQRHPGHHTLVDPFSGGLAVTHAFHLAGWDTRPSDIDGSLTELISRAITGELRGRASRWVTRREFEEAAAAGHDATDWEAEYIRCAWSFGTDRATYAYGRHKEDAVRAAHGLVFDRVTSPLLARYGIPVGEQEAIVRLRTSSAREAAVSRKSRGRLRLQYSERCRRLNALPPDCPHPVRADYRDVLAGPLPDGAVVYLDPPYAGTKTYPGAPPFDTGVFWAAAADLAGKGTPVYVSEYDAPPQWRPVLTFTRPQTLSADPRSKSTLATERVYTYRP